MEGFSGQGDLGALFGAKQEQQDQYHQDALSESRAERASRLTIANNQLKAERARIAVAEGQAAADKWYKEQQIRLADETMALDREKFAVGTGLNLLQLRSTLRGPGDWAQYIDAAEGFNLYQPSSKFLGTLAAGQMPQVAGIGLGMQPTPASLQGLATAPADQQKARLAADMSLANTVASNPGKLAPGSLESLSPDFLKYFTGLATTGGHSADTLMKAYSQAGIGQGSAFGY